MRYLRCLALLSLLTWYSMTLSAQVAISGRITGVVTDNTGATIEGATVEVTGTALMHPRSVHTQAGGAYLVEQLPPGEYDVTCSQPGFQVFLEKHVVLIAGFTATVNPALHIGSATQTVEVTGQGPVVDVQGTSAPTTFETSLLQNIPSGRDPWSTVAQVPGTTTSTFDVAGNQSAQQSSMSVHGSKTTEAVYSFNGLNLDWPGGSGGSTAFYVDYDSFQEVQVVTDAAPPEVSVGGVYINMVTKSGSNQFHGMAAGYYLTNGTQAALKSTTFTSPTTGVTSPVTNAGSPLIMARDITANGGGALIRDRLWGFGAYRYYVVKDAQLASLNSNGLPGTDPNHQSNGTIRLDYQASPKNHLDGIWLYNIQNRFYRRSTSYTYVDQQAAGRQIEPAWAGQAQWTATITPSFLVDTRAGYMHLHEDQQNEPGVTPTTYSVADATLSTLKGVQQTYPLTRSGLTRIASSASWFKGGWMGSHNFKGGGEWAIASTNANTNAPQGLNVFFNNGVAYQVRVYNTPIVSQSLFHSYALFLQDAWTIHRNLTINVGGRFDHFRTFNPGQCSPQATFSTLFTTRCFARADLADFNNIVPRISVAFDPTGKGNQVIRAGYNRFMLSQGTTLASTVNPNTASGNIYNWKDTNGDGIPQPSEYLNTPATPATFGGINTTIDPNISRPYSDQVNVGYQREILKSISVGVSYYYRTTKNQIARINTALPASAYTSTLTVANPLVSKYPNVGAPATLTLYNLDPSYKTVPAAYELTNVAAVSDNHYNAFEITASRRFDRHWQVLAGFTYQRNKGTYSATTSDDFNDPNQNINRYNSSIDQDAPFVFKLDGTYVWPLKISTSVNYQHTTGYPLLPTYVIPVSVGLVQSETIKLAPNGAMRLDTVDDINMRIARPTSFFDNKILFEPIVDLNNLTNANPVIARTASWGTNFFRQSNFLNPFVARFGLKMTW
jgi:hypothetical protein